LLKVLQAILQQKTEIYTKSRRPSQAATQVRSFEIGATYRWVRSSGFRPVYPQQFHPRKIGLARTEAIPSPVKFSFRCKIIKLTITLFPYPFSVLAIALFIYYTSVPADGTEVKKINKDVV